MMLKFLRERPISSKAVFCALALAVIEAPATDSDAFPISDGQQATLVLGWNNFTQGFVDGDDLLGATATSAASFFVTADVAFDPANERLFVADIHNHRILVFDATNGLTSGMTAAFVLGQPDFVTGGSDPNNPYGNRNTQNFAFGCATAVNACGVTRLNAVAYDPARQWVFGADSDNHRVLIWDISGGISNGQPADYVLGQRDLQSSGANAGCTAASAAGVNACGMKTPSALLYDNNSATLYVADSGNHRVLSFDVSSAPTTGTQASAVLGQDTLTVGLRGNGCGAAGANTTDACSLDFPVSLALDPQGERLFVSDYGRRRVLGFDIAGGISNGDAADIVIGQSDFVSGGANGSCGNGSISACGFGEWDVHLDFNQNDRVLYAADAANNRVLAFDVDGLSNGQAASSVLGRTNFTSFSDADSPSFGGGTDRRRLIAPFGVAYDADSDRIFVSDGANHRIMIYGSNVTGVPVDVTGNPETVDTTQGDDGSISVDVENEDGDIFIVTFPPGTEPDDGEDNIVVDVDTTNFGPLSFPTVRVNANLNGGTKTITMSKGSFSVMCIWDHAEDTRFTAGSFFCTGHGVRHWHGLPSAGSCRTVSAHGDLGDNPNNANDTSGTHDVAMCVDASNQYVTVSGLKHTTLALAAEEALEELAGDEGVERPHEHGESTPDSVSAGGCQSTSGSGNAWAGLVLLALAWALGRPLRATQRARSKTQRAPRA